MTSPTKHQLTVAIAVAAAVAPSFVALVGPTIPPQYQALWAALVTVGTSVYHLYETSPTDMMTLPSTKASNGH